MAPKTSLFPPNRQKIRRAEEARKNQIKTMGDLELTADMQSQFVGQMTQEQKDFIGGKNPEKSKLIEELTYLDDPIAQYGFDPDRIRFQEPDKYQIQDVWSSNRPTTTDANAEYNPGSTKTGPNKKDIEEDIIKYGVKLGSSKEIIAHEARHRGFQLLRNMQLEGSEEDQKAWIEKYGREAAGLLDIYFSRNPRHKFSAETINEIRDRPDAKFNSPKFDAEGNPPNMGLFRGGDRNAAIQFVPLEDLRESKKSGRIKFSGDFNDLGGNLRASLSNEFINKAFQGLDKAAKDAMKKQKNDYRKKMTVRSQEGERKFANGGSVEDQTGQAFKGMGYGEIIADNLIGLDNEYESLGEKIGKQFNQDEVAFLKTMGVGMAKGAYDVVTNPDPLAYVKAAKEGVKEFAVGATDFLFKDLDTRLQEMFKTDYNNATPEQVTKARESVIGDAVIASGILPAGKVVGNIAESIVDAGTNVARKIDLSKVNSAMARANEIAEDVEGKVDQSVLGRGYRLAAKERIGKGKGKERNPTKTDAALNMGMSEKVFHVTNNYDSNEKIYPGTMQWNPDEGKYNIPPDKKGEITTLQTPDETLRDRASFQGMTLKELIEKEGLDYLDDARNAHDFLGVHVGTSKAAAARHADNVKEDKVFGKQKTVGSTTQQLRVRTNAPFTDNGKPWTEKGLNTFLRKEMSKIKDGMVYEKMQVIRRDLADRGFTHVPYINNIEDRKNISYAMLVDRPQDKGVAVIRDLNAKFNVDDRAKRDQRLAQGGVAMKDQMEMSFALGGVAETIDPVSGNDVPPGSLPVEVRDDIPARLSEGEYVVPADVVRFFGVKYFEDLRAEAKMGLQQMDADGRIGGEPINAQPSDGEISEQELMAILKEELNKEQPKNLPNLKPKPIARMNKGGLASTTMAAYNPGGLVPAKEIKTVNPKFKPLSNSYGGSNQGASKGMTSIPYENNSGDIMYFTFINGVLYPRGVVIPPNFKVMAGYQDFVPEGQKGDLTPTPETPKTDEVKIKEEGGDTDVVSDSDAWMDKFEFDGTTSQIIANASNVLKGGETGSFLSEGLSTLSPMFGLIDPVIKASNYAQVAGTVIALEESMKGDETYTPNKEDLDAYNSLKTELAAYRKANKLDRLPNELYNGDAFARQINAIKFDFALGRNAKDLDGNLVFKTDKQFSKQMQKNAPMGQVYNPTTESYVPDGSFSDEERYKGLGTTVTNAEGDSSFRSFTPDETKAAQKAGVVGSQRPEKRPAFSGNSRSSNNDESNNNSDGGFDSDPDNKPGHLYQTGGLVQRRKKKK